MYVDGCNGRECTNVVDIQEVLFRFIYLEGCKHANWGLYVNPNNGDKVCRTCKHHVYKY